VRGHDIGRRGTIVCQRIQYHPSVRGEHIQKTARIVIQLVAMPTRGWPLICLTDHVPRYKEYCTRFAKSETNYNWYYIVLYSPELIVFEAWSLASSPSAWFAVPRPTQIPAARFSLPCTPIRQISKLFVNQFVNIWQIYDDNKTINYEIMKEYNILYKYDLWLFAV